MADPDIRVVLADDHAMVREGLAQILEDNDRITVVGQADNGFKALELAASETPDVVVLDYSMPKMDGPTTTENLRRRFPNIRVLILTVHENIHYAVKVLEIGALGYVIKSAAPQELVAAIHSVWNGEVYISPKISQNVIQHLCSPKKDRAGIGALSKREFEVLRAFGAGMSLRDCARYLNIGTSTASTYRARLMEKLKLGNTAEIIRFALENDIVA